MLLWKCERKHIYSKTQCSFHNLHKRYRFSTKMWLIFQSHWWLKRSLIVPTICNLFQKLPLYDLTTLGEMPKQQRVNFDNVQCWNSTADVPQLSQFHSLHFRVGYPDLCEWYYTICKYTYRPTSFGGNTKSCRSLLSGVYAKGSKKNHTKSVNV